MYFDRQLQEIRNHARNCLKELGPLELTDPSDLYPLIAITSNESDILRFTKSVVLATHEFTITSEPELLSTIHLYGPENLGNHEIIYGHPVIRPPSGKGIEALHSPKINLNQMSNIDDIVRINENYREYLFYFQNVFKITNNILSAEEKDLINLCYDSVLKRQHINGSHNLLNAEESVSNIVLTSICRNSLRMMRYKKYKPDRFIQPCETKYLNKIINPCNDIECLKDGSINNITTFLAIYSLNVLEFPCTIDHISLTLSTRYQHKYNNFNEYIIKKFNDISEYHDLRLRKPETPDVKKAIALEKEMALIKTKVIPIIEQSIADLKKDKIVISHGKKILPNANSLLIRTNIGFQEINMPSVETIRKRRKSIKNFDLFLKRKSIEWKHN